MPDRGLVPSRFKCSKIPYSKSTNYPHTDGQQTY